MSSSLNVSRLDLCLLISIYTACLEGPDAISHGGSAAAEKRHGNAFISNTCSA